MKPVSLWMMRFLRPVPGIACTFALLLATTPARAEPTASDRATARTLMQQGRDLRDKGDLKEALKRFQAADDMVHAPSTAYELARTQVALGLLVEARDTLAAIRRIPAKPNDPAPFKEARAKAEELDSTLASRVPSLTITLKGAPDGETPAVSIDGEQIPAGAIGLPRAVNPGHHVVVVNGPTTEGKQEIDMREAEQKPMEVALVAKPPQAIASEEPTAKEPEQPLPPHTSHSPTLLTWDALGLTVVAVAVGTVTGAMSLSKKSALQRECTNDVCGPSSYADYSSANSLATVSTIAFSVAGVGAVVAIVTLAAGHGVPTPPPAQSASRPTVTPWIGLGAAGVRGTF